MQIKVWHSLVIGILLLAVTCQLDDMPQCQPFGLRLNLGRKFFNQSQTQMLGIKFNTRGQCPRSYVFLEQPQSFIVKIPCTNSIVQLGDYYSYVHKCSVYNLQIGDKFLYMAYGLSSNYADQPIPFSQDGLIHAHLLNNNNLLKFVVMADWGYLRAKAGIYDPLDNAFKTMITMDEEIDGIYIGGDIAYDLDSYQGLYYEDFIKMLSQVASRWPLLLNIGNHQHLTEQDQYISKSSFEDYDLFKTRITVINLPNINWVMFDPYNIVFQGEDPTQLTKQFDQTLKQLTTKNPHKPIITSSHYSYKCNGNIPDCYDVRQLLLPLFNKMMQYNVLFYIGAHHHSYERPYPHYYNDTYLKKQSPYLWVEGGKPNYLDNTLITVVEGIAGNDREIVEEYPPEQDFIAAYVVNNTGFGIMTVKQTLLTYDHVNHDDPYISADHWQIILQKKTKDAETEPSGKNLKMERE